MLKVRPTPQVFCYVLVSGNFRDLVLDLAKTADTGIKHQGLRHPSPQLDGAKKRP